jgi:hypothetical protein
MFPTVLHPPVEIKDRVTYFLRLLKENPVHFHNARQAHSHIAKALHMTEVKHRCTRNKMFILPFDDFYFDHDFSIHFRETINQSILIHHNGAYGIFQNNVRCHTSPLAHYKEGKHAELLHIANSFGKKLW